MNPGFEEYLIGIDIPYSGHKTLVEQETFEAALAFPEPPREIGARHFQRLRAQPGEFGTCPNRS